GRRKTRKMLEGRVGRWLDGSRRHVRRSNGGGSTRRRAGRTQMTREFTYVAASRKFSCGKQPDYDHLTIVNFEAPGGAKASAWCCNMGIDLDGAPQAYGPLAISCRSCRGRGTLPSRPGTNAPTSCPTVPEIRRTPCSRRRWAPRPGWS